MPLTEIRHSTFVAPDQIAYSVDRATFFRRGAFEESFDRHADHVGPSATIEGGPSVELVEEGFGHPDGDLALHGMRCIPPSCRYEAVKAEFMLPAA